MKKIFKYRLVGALDDAWGRTATDTSDGAFLPADSAEPILAYAELGDPSNLGTDRRWSGQHSCPTLHGIGPTAHENISRNFLAKQKVNLFSRLIPLQKSSLFLDRHPPLTQLRGFDKLWRGCELKEVSNS